MKDRFKEIRKKNNLTQEAFGNRIGLTRTYVNLIEAGKNIPADRTIKDICREFHINEKWLRTGDGDMYAFEGDEVGQIVADLVENPESKTYQIVLSLLKTYSKLNAENRRHVDAFIEELLGEIRKEEN